jgi:hypothetical protein
VTITKGQQHAMNKAHQVIDISTRVPTKSIRIERNYSLGDGITRFNTEYPIELTGRVSCFVVNMAFTLIFSIIAKP